MWTHLRILLFKIKKYTYWNLSKKSVHIDRLLKVWITCKHLLFLKTYLSPQYQGIDYLLCKNTLRIYSDEHTYCSWFFIPMILFSLDSERLEFLTHDLYCEATLRSLHSLTWENPIFKHKFCFDNQGHHTQTQTPTHLCVYVCTEDFATYLKYLLIYPFQQFNPMKNIMGTSSVYRYTKVTGFSFFVFCFFFYALFDLT